LLQRTKNIKKFRAYYKKTERNKQSGMVFEDLGFKQVSKKANLLVLELKTPPSKTDEIMTVEWI
jgi:predicted enzyme involved in methoxymalonyl-ACP biosynthesis